MARIPIGLQLYSVREQCKQDLPGTLKAVARMGYAGVEFAGYYERSAKDLRKMLDDNGLKCCGTHTSMDSIEGDNLKKTMEFNKVLGNKFLIVPGIPQEKRKTRADWLAVAKFFDAAAEKAKGFRVGYHNHHVEFQELDGERPWDTFFGNTKPAVVMQFDTGNALKGGGQAVVYLKKYPGRSATVHVKEYSAKNDKALIGEGDIPWQEFFGLCETIGKTEWYIVEQESYAYPPLECVDRCLKNLRAMGK